MIQLVQNKGLDLYELVSDLGLLVGNYPYTPSDCFSYQGVSKEVEKIFRDTKVGSLTTLIKGIIPHDKPISGKYSNPADLIHEIKINHTSKGINKYNNTAAVKYAPTIVESGINKFIGFYLVCKMDEAKEFPPLMEMREVILAARIHQQVTIRGCYKGPNAEASFESSMALLRANNKRIITDRSCLLMQEYFLKKYFIEKDEEAGKLLEEITRDNQKLLPPPSGNKEKK